MSGRMRPSSSVGWSAQSQILPSGCCTAFSMGKWEVPSTIGTISRFPTVISLLPLVDVLEGG